MVERWFRFYDGVPDDPKVLKLSDKQFRVWAFLLCIANRYGGVITEDRLEDAAITMRVSLAKLHVLMREMVACCLFDETETGYAPHNWNGRQYKSDVSTERVKRFRKRSMKQDETVSVTPPEDRVQKTETDKKKEVVAPTALPAWMPLETWTSFLTTRKKLSPHASKLLVSQLSKLKEGGDDPKEVLEQSIMNGWKGLFPLKKANGYGQRKPTATDQHLAGIASLVEDIRERRNAGQG